MFEKNQLRLVWALVMTLCGFTMAQAQSTEFTYQGRLLSSTFPANGSHDFEFSLWDAVTDGNQIGSTVTLTAVNVNNGVFSVRIDFGNQFPGANRFLEIRVKESGGSEYATLTPRQAISSSPYAIKSLSATSAINAATATNAANATNATSATNATNLGGIPATRYILTTDSRLSDARTPLPNSPNYVQNTASPQLNTQFYISGTGRANLFDATTAYHLGGNRVLSVQGVKNVFAGVSAGQMNAGGEQNAFFGYEAGQANTIGGINAFFGYQAGKANTTGNFNAFFGHSAGLSNTDGFSNSFFGFEAGKFTTGGLENSFVGHGAGFSNTIGIYNTFLGTSSGSHNTTGAYNTTIGAGADVGSGNLTNATAIGAGAVVFNSNTIQLGTSSDNVNVSGKLKLENFGSSGSTAVCRNSLSQLSACSSSIRYKTNLTPYSQGLNLIKRLRPVTFNWKADNTLDFGLVAEEVAEIEPLLVTRNERGEIEGVKYDRVGVVLINTVQEQQRLIETQQQKVAAQQQRLDQQIEIIRRQQAELDALKKLICAQNPTAEFCQTKEVMR
jgi:hypothetical protein